MAESPSTRVSPEPPSLPSRQVALRSFAVSLAVFAAFAGYAYLTQATYRTTASVVVSPPAGKDLDVDPLEATERVRNALRDLSAGSTIQSLDGRRFDFVCQAASADTVVKACDELARRAVARLPELFKKTEAPPVAPKLAEQQRKAEELVAFLAAHPELTDPQKAIEARDPKIALLREEQSALEALLAREPQITPQSPGATNAPANVDPAKTRARLAEIAKELRTRRAALGNTPAPKPSPELRARWQELVKSAAEPAKLPEGAPQTTVLPVAHLAEAPARPTSPVTPNRPLVLLLGAVLGAGCGLGLIASAQRRGRLPARVGDAESSSTEQASSLSPSASTLEGSAPVHGAAQGEDSFDPSPNEEARLDEGARFDEELAQEPEWAPPPLESQPASPSTSEPPSLGSGAPPREDAGLVRRAPIIELNAHEPMPTPAQLRAVHPPADLAVQGAGGRGPAPRITQTLGSPAAPGSTLSSHPASLPPPGYRASPPAHRNTSYRYVSTPPSGTPRQTPPPPPISTPPPPHPSSFPPSDALSPRPSRVSERPLPPSASVAPIASPSIVSPHPAPKDWRPDPSLAPESRRALSNELFPHAVIQCFVIGVAGVRGAADVTSRVSAELALALSETGHPRVLLLEGNLQRPAVQRWMRVEMPLFTGFSEQLEGRVQPDRARGGWTVVACSPTLHVLAEGVMRRPELILSRQFDEAVSEFRNYYDVIVVSGPLIAEAAACRAMQDVVDGVILVCPDESKSQIAEASSLFARKRFSSIISA